MIFILPVITLLLFVINVFYRGNSVQSCLLFVLTLLPLMDLKVTPEALGGFKTFDVISFYCLIFLLKEFITIDLSGRNNFYFLLFFTMVVIFLLGGLASEFPEKTYLKLVKFLPIFIFARFFLTEIYKDEDFLPKAIQALKVSYLTALSFLLVQWIVGLKFTFYPGLHPNTIDPIYHIVRYPGVFYDSQASGQYLAMGSFLFLYIEDGASRKTYIFNYTVFALSILAINLAGSRSAFGGFAIGVMISFFLAARKYRIYGAVALVAAYLIFTGVAIHTGVFDRTENLSEDFLFRQSIWKKAFEISQKHPYLGIGSGNYQSYVTRHAQDQYLEIEDGQLVYFDQPENGYLKIMVELGFIGFFIFMLYLLVPLAKGFIQYIKGFVDNRIAFFMASLISWIVAFNTVYSIYDYRLLIMVTSMIVLIVSYPAKAYYYEVAENQQV
ncbi:O-antigen ligase family protein [Mucilaginibacter lacusdianchii]|uniref:O-antigen ligase family protein n=1 Tax=Mucilaginibacter lacusdianchii TaxID=2684211 RepID=UPI00131D5687|nr:O-antigen ligase family protein [Mucilaginibacter sp. JXJ CY 39]